MPNTIEQFGPNVVKKEPVVGETIPAGTDVQSILVSRDQKARLGAEAEKRYRDFNVWFLSSPMYREHDEDIPDARKHSEEVSARRKDIEQETRQVHYQSFRYSELEHKLADAYPGPGEVYSYHVPDLVVMLGGKGYLDDEPESDLSRRLLDAEMIPIRDIRKSADSVLFPFSPSGKKIEGDWAGEFLDMHVLGRRLSSLIAEDREVTSEIAAEFIATELIGTDQDWHILSKAFDEYSENGDATTLAKAVTPGRVKRAIARAKKRCSKGFLMYHRADEERGFQSEEALDKHARNLVAAVDALTQSMRPEELTRVVAGAFKRIIDERVGAYQSDVDRSAAEERLLQPVVIAVGPSVRFRERAILAGADATLPALAGNDIGKLTSLAARMRSSPASIVRERFRRNKSDFYRGVEGEIESRSELTADTEKELIILSSLLAKIGAKKVLDVGCGYGRLAKPLAEMGFDVAGIDANRSLLEKAKEAKGKRRNLHYKTGDIIEYRDAVKGGSYDAVYYGWHSFLEAHGLGNALASLRSAYAALRPGGVLTFDQPSRENPGMGDGSYGDEAHGYFAYLMDEDELDLMLRLAGFEDLHIHKWTTKPSAIYPEGMKKWTIVATKPEVKESEDKWWLKESDMQHLEQPRAMSESSEALPREQWDALITSLGELKKSVYERAKHDPTFSEKFDFEKREFQQTLGSAKQSLGESELQKYAAFHWFVGSSTTYEHSPKGDLPGAYSIRGFFERCLRDEFVLWEELGWMRENRKSEQSVSVPDLAEKADHRHKTEKLLSEFRRPEIAKELRRITLFGAFGEPDEEMRAELHGLGEELAENGVSIVIGGKYGYLSEVADGVIDGEGRVIVVNAAEHKERGIGIENIPGALREVTASGGYIGKKSILYHDGIGAYVVLPHNGKSRGTQIEITDALHQPLTFDRYLEHAPRPIIFLGTSWMETYDKSIRPFFQEDELEHVHFAESPAEIIRILEAYSAKFDTV